MDWSSVCCRFCKGRGKIAVADIGDSSKTIQRVKESGSEGIFIKTGVSREEQCITMGKATFDLFGGIDILINNAAILASIVLKPFTDWAMENRTRISNGGSTWKRWMGSCGFLTAQV